MSWHVSCGIVLWAVSHTGRAVSHNAEIFSLKLDRKVETAVLTGCKLPAVNGRSQEKLF